MIKKLLFLVSFLMIAVLAFAQPEIDHSQHGCHYFQHREAYGAAIADVPINADAINERSDTIDILHYDITTDVTDYGGDLTGETTITFTPKMDGINWIVLDLEGLTVDSVWNEVDTMYYVQRQDTFLTKVFFNQPMNIGDTASITLAYSGEPITVGNFGGFYYEDNYAYNLSIGIEAYPHNFGRAWFPCFDNFQERSFYTFRIITPANHRAKASGEFVEVVDMGNRKMWVYEMNKPLPTYLASIASSTYVPIRWNHEGEFGTVPIEIMARPRDSNDVKRAFANLGTAMTTFEDWYGKMEWSTVGYSMATRGAMEDPHNIIYPQNQATDGATNDRLMAHELCHQWWGNAVNPKTSQDMWIKEGNAEYGAHLFFEKEFDQEIFQNIVQDNLAQVLKSAHVNDDEYRALSPMPPTHTYGTHTYNKGASMIHNMRGYLGDELFEQGQKAVLEAFRFQPMDAYEYRDQLTAATGVDMKDYFDAWIFAPGFSDFEVDSFDVVQQGNMYEVTVHIQQKLRATTAFHNNIPVFLTFVDENLNEQVERVMMSGEFYSPTIQLPFNPKHTFVNAHQEMNLGQLNDTRIVTSQGPVNFSNTSFAVTVESITDSAYLHVVHHWTAPDHPVDNPTEARFSNSHYWSVLGDIPDDFEASVLFQYDGTQGSGFLDADLMEFTEDSLILAYRKDASEPWGEYPDYSKTILGPTDKKGFIRITKLRLGDYTFVNGELEPITPTKKIKTPDFYAEAFPNPTSGQMTLKGFYDDLKSNEITATIYDALGKKVADEVIQVFTGEFNQTLDLSSFSEGIYFANLYSENRVLLGTQKLIVK